MAQGSPILRGRSLSVRASILSTVFVVALAAVIIGVLGLVELQQVSGDGEKIYTESYEPSQDVANLGENIYRVRWAARSKSAAPDQKSKSYYQEELDKAIKIVTDSTQIYKSRAIGDDQRKEIEAFSQNWNAYNEYREQTNELIAQGKAAQAQAFIAEKLNPAIASAQESLDKLGKVSEEQATRHIDRMRNTNSNARLTIIAALIICVGAAVGLALRTAASIMNPLDKIRAVLAAVADGDLTRRAEVAQNNELGQMAQALTRAIDRMRTMVKTMVDSSSAMTQRAAQLQSSSHNLSGMASETTDQVTRIHTATTDVAAGIQSVAGGATQMGASIREIASNAQKAAQVANEAVSVAGATDEIMSRLGASSMEIGNVIKLINAIAEQTNLLALNATIEAARAGDAGKGFAVVANEVKDLAQETSRATDDISQRVEAIQTDAGGAAQSISGVTEVIGQIDSYQTTIASAVEEQSATTNSMASDLEHASDDVSRITEGIDKVRQAAEATGAGVHEVGDAATEMAALSAELQSTVAAYRY
ncbi:MAG: methyl-accepting chemotaxis protein [Actinomycetota bacterium]|nr:methyl-accepting chemotaxis protein [Actinomycetota bacterium]